MVFGFWCLRTWGFKTSGFGFRRFVPEGFKVFGLGLLTVLTTSQTQCYAAAFTVLLGVRLITFVAFLSILAALVTSKEASRISQDTRTKIRQSRHHTPRIFTDKTGNTEEHVELPAFGQAHDKWCSLQHTAPTSIVTL